MKEGRLRLLITFILKCMVIISVIIGIPLSAHGAKGVFMSGSTVFMYFTIQSNILIGLICLVGLLFLVRKYKPGNGWYTLKYVGTVAITLTGVVFCFILAPTLGDHAWNVHNILTHVVVPVGAVIDFFVTGTDSDIKKKSVYLVMIPPLLYAIYAAIGFVNGWEFSKGKNYPYFFLNWSSPAGVFGFSDELPFMGCAWWIIAILLFLLGIGYFYLRILDILKKKQQMGSFT